jgi:hypothetical protein
MRSPAASPDVAVHERTASLHTNRTTARRLPAADASWCRERVRRRRGAARPRDRRGGRRRIPDSGLADSYEKPRFPESALTAALWRSRGFASSRPRRAPSRGPRLTSTRRGAARDCARGVRRARAPASQLRDSRGPCSRSPRGGFGATAMSVHLKFQPARTTCGDSDCQRQRHCRLPSAEGAKRSGVSAGAALCDVSEFLD